MNRSDLDAVAALERAVFEDPWSRASFVTEVNGGATHWNRVAEMDGQVVGYAVAWFVADEVHLGNLAVAPPWRGRGLAQRMLDELLTDGEQRGSRMVILEVRRSNLAAQTLYTKNGFTLLMVRRGYYQNNREDALVMARPLVPCPEKEAGA